MGMPSENYFFLLGKAFLIFLPGEHSSKFLLRIPDSYDAKIAKICYLGTLWPVIQLKDHIFEIRQKAFLPNAP